MRNWRAVCLLLHCAIAGVLSCTNGDIQVLPSLPNLKAGRIIFCHNGGWKDICHHGWDEREAKVACRQLGFSEEGAHFCTNSCFGSGEERLGGRTDFACSGNEAKLSECIFSLITGDRARSGYRCKDSEYAGVMCYNTSVLQPVPTAVPTTCLPHPTCTPPVTMAPPTCHPQPSPTTPPSPELSPATPPTTCPPPPPPCVCTEAPPTTTTPPCLCPATQSLSNTSKGASDDGSMLETTVKTNLATLVKTECPAKAVGTVLGAVSAALLVTLVGVVMGWVWHCYKPKKDENSKHSHDFINPTYSPTCIPTHIPSTQYSSTGPRDTPTGHAPQQESRYYQEIELAKNIYYEGGLEAGKEGVYHVLGDVGEGKENGGMLYEVPIETKNKKEDKSAGRAVEKAYATLNYN